MCVFINVGYRCIDRKVRCAWIFIIAEDTIPGVLTRAREDWEEGEEEEIKKYYCYGGEVVMVVWYMYGSAPTRQAYRFKVFARDLFYSHAVYIQYVISTFFFFFFLSALQIYSICRINCTHRSCRW